MISVGGWTFSDEILTRIMATIEAEPELSRRPLSRRVCEWVDWRNSAGRLQEMSCRKALLKLHERGLIRLAPLKKRDPFQEAKVVTVVPPIATVAGSRLDGP